MKYLFDISSKTIKRQNPNFIELGLLYYKEKHESNERVQFRYGLVFLLNLTMNISNALRPKERAIQLHNLILYSCVETTITIFLFLNCFNCKTKIANTYLFPYFKGRKDVCVHISKHNLFY